MSVIATDNVLITFDPAALPTQDDLPCSDGIPMETARHYKQMTLLIYALQPYLSTRFSSSFVAGNMFLYYSPKQIKKNDFVGPDVFVALDVLPETQRERKSWVVWEEGKVPDVVIELLSESTARYDKTEKKALYQNALKVPEYFCYDPWNSDDLTGFRLEQGVYQPIIPNQQGDLYCQQLDCLLTRWHGAFAEVTTTWLRWADLDGHVLSTYTEIERQGREREQVAKKLAEQRADIEHANRKLAEQRADIEHVNRKLAEQRTNIERQSKEREQIARKLAEQRANQAEQHIDKLVEHLRALGIDPDKLN